VKSISELTRRQGGSRSTSSAVVVSESYRRLTDGSGSVLNVGELRVHRTLGSGSPTTTQLTVTLTPADATTVMLSRRPSVIIRLGQANCFGDRCFHCMLRSRCGALQTGCCCPDLNPTVGAVWMRSCSHRSRQSHSHGLSSTRSRFRTDGDGRYSTVAGPSWDRLLPAILRSTRCGQPANPRRSIWTIRHAVKSIDSMSGRLVNEYAST